MNKILISHMLKNFLKTILMWVMIFYCFGVILNLFEEIEFFKNIEVNFFIPLILTSIFIPSMIVQLLPFIIFISGMWYMVKIRNNRDLLTLKIFGFSNLKIFFILAFTSFVLGWFVLFCVNPITSSMAKYYEQTKSNYSRDIDHLVSFNKNGLWIKESFKKGERIITANKPKGLNLVDVAIFHLDENYNVYEKIIAKNVNIEKNDWILKDVTIYSEINGLFVKNEIASFSINSIYNYEKITTLFKNFDTMSFLDLLINYNSLIDNGYNKKFLNQNLHSMLSLPFFLLLMTALAAILTLNTLKRSDNLRFIIIGLIIIVLVFYFKDLSIALGQTDRIPLILAVWAPVLALSFFASIGVLQINEK